MSPTYFTFGASAVKLRSTRSGTCSSAGSGTVVRTRRRSRMPAILFWAITRATRLWFTRSAGSAPSLSSAVTRGAPYARLPGSARTARTRAASSSSAAWRAVRASAAASHA